MGETIGYARISTNQQSLDVQREKLVKAGCKLPLFEEIKSGANSYNRPKLRECLDYVRQGDRLVVTKLDRLSRSLLDLVQTAELLKKKGVELIVLDQNIDTSRAEGRLLFGLIGIFGSFELSLRAERQRDGIEKARRNGIKFGRKPVLNEKQRHSIVRQWCDHECSARELAHHFGVGIATIYRTLQTAGAAQTN